MKALMHVSVKILFKKIYTEERFWDKLFNCFSRSLVLKFLRAKYTHIYITGSHIKNMYFWGSRGPDLVGLKSLFSTGDGVDYILRSSASILKLYSFTKSYHQRIYIWINYYNLPQKWLHRIVIHFSFLVFVEGYMKWLYKEPFYPL